MGERRWRPGRGQNGWNLESCEIVVGWLEGESG